jgi:hypothetical protein
VRQFLLRHVGLVKPYRFERTLIVLVAAALFVFIAIVAVLLYARDDLTPASTSPRCLYFLYLMALLASACLLAPRPRIATALLCLAAIEAGLGAGSVALYKYHLAPSPVLIPLDFAIMRIDWHPLLQGVPAPTTEAETAQGIPAVNADHMRGKDITADTLRGKVIVDLFGGSTTFDEKDEGQSWPERLQVLLGDRYAVLNRGMSGYSTAEHVIQTAFYERAWGFEPQCAVYYVGWNDLRSAHMTALDPAYATVHLPSQVDTLRARRSDMPATISPLMIFFSRILALTVDTIRPAVAEGTISSEPDPALEDIFARNVETISAINRLRGIRTIWVGQVMNRAKLTETMPSPWVPFVVPTATFGLIERLDGILKREVDRLGDVHVGLPVDKFTSEDFGDEGHFTEQGSLRFATLLAPDIARSCPSVQSP